MEHQKVPDPASDDDAMREALSLADLAAAAGEVPVGAVVLQNGRIIGRGYNRPIADHDPTAHAEIIAIRDAARAAGNYRLTDAALVVTVEPCLMCLGAMAHARIGRLVYGAPEPKAGAVESAARVDALPMLNHRFVVVSGVMARACADRLQKFFRERR
jgi:tRNA(adenine34) deaminase